MSVGTCIFLTGEIALKSRIVQRKNMRDTESGVSSTKIE